ncbi:hypothetical protein halTADL_1504 [Halohasta litchfieldiae]|jgi:hypothetical protein|uniref:Uncharacterized protein n=1 Tax=Halohasta litchfieldiae TaxID=1073996 RepID=A0A1H6W385_9EURY|nr:DUF5805 domain-containing protein [Halohasta litchfieldiae]ATW88269.1 hypothetical protein halTADL_1504 [Halohasta litchfieldiae]SEJ06735.1 hypothetical protein SAMN05444271_1199 [Halohasta litchfieldiae]
MAFIQISDVPDEWLKEADERNLSRSEYAKRMIRGGRRQFGHDYAPNETPATPNTLKLDESTGSEIETQLKAWIHANLSTDDAQDVDDLVDLLEDDLATLADELCDEQKAKYRRSKGGYLKIPTNE